MTMFDDNFLFLSTSYWMLFFILFPTKHKKIDQQQNIPVFRSFNASFFSTSVKFYFKPKFPFLFLCDLTPAWTALENHLKQKLGVQYLWLLEIVFQYSVY